MSGISARAIYRLVEAGEVHFAETARGLTLICAASCWRRLADTMPTLDESRRRMWEEGTA